MTLARDTFLIFLSLLLKYRRKTTYLVQVEVLLDFKCLDVNTSNRVAVVEDDLWLLLDIEHEIGACIELTAAKRLYLFDDFTKDIVIDEVALLLYGDQGSVNAVERDNIRYYRDPGDTAISLSQWF